ncbi:MAG: hypothetical protein V4487_05090 [Chlamydiota bacterium]
MSDSKKDRHLIYLGSSKKDAEKLPQEIKDLFSTALKMALNGETHADAKLYKHHGSGVFEVVGDYRKKSKKGSGVPKEEKELIEQRFKWAEQIYKEKYGKKKKRN